MIIVAVKLDKFAREIAHAGNSVGRDHRASPEHRGLEFGALRHDGADRVDMRSARDHRGLQKRRGRARDQGYDVGVFYSGGDARRGFDFQFQLCACTFRESGRVFGIAAGHVHAPELAHRGNCRDLGERLFARAHQRHLGRVRRGEPSSREPADCGGAQLSERERLNHRHQLAVGGVEQDQQGIRAALGVCPGLGADHSLGQHRCADRVQGVAMAERGMGLRHVDRAAPGLRREPALQRPYRIAHVDQRGDFRLRDPERLTAHRVTTVHSCVIHKG